MNMNVNNNPNVLNDLNIADLQNLGGVNDSELKKAGGNEKIILPNPESPDGSDKVNVEEPKRSYNAEMQARAIQTISGGMAELMMLLSKIASDDKRLTRDMNIEKINNVAQEQQAIADKIRSTAGEALAMGLVSAGIQIVSGAVTLGLSTAAASKEIKGLNQQQQVKTETLKVEQQQIDAHQKALSDNKAFDKTVYDMKQTALSIKELDAKKLSTTGQLLSAKAQVSSTFMNAAASAVNSGSEYNNKMSEAANKEKEANIATIQSTMEALKAHVDFMNDLSAKAREAASAVLRAETDAQRAILS